MQLTPEVQTPIDHGRQRCGPARARKKSSRRSSSSRRSGSRASKASTKMSSESADSLGTVTLEFQSAPTWKMPASGRQPAAAGARVSRGRRSAGHRDASIAEPADRLVHSSAEVSVATTSSTRSRKRSELADELRQVRNAAQHNVGLARIASARAGRRSIRSSASCCRPPDLDVTKLRRFAEDEIESRFERVPGVSQSNVLGGLEDELQVVVDPEKLAARRITSDAGPQRASRPERGHVGRRLLGRQTPLGGPRARPVPHARTGGKPAAGRPRRRTGVRPRRGRGAARLQEARRLSSAASASRASPSTPAARPAPTSST